MADVSGALSDVSLNTKLPSLTFPSCRLQTARGGGIPRPPERLLPTIQGSIFAFPWSAVPGSRLLSFGGLCATVLHLLRRGIIFDTFFHRTSDSRITNKSCEEQAINQPFARLSSLQNGTTFVSIVPFGTTHNTVLKIECNYPDRHMRFQFFKTLDRGF